MSPATSLTPEPISPAKSIWLAGGVTPEEAARKDMRIGDTVLATIGEACELTFVSVVLDRRPDDAGMPVAHEAARWTGYTQREQIGEFEGDCAKSLRLAWKQAGEQRLRADRNAALALGLAAVAATLIAAIVGLLA